MPSIRSDDEKKGDTQRDVVLTAMLEVYKRRSESAPWPELPDGEPETRSCNIIYSMVASEEREEKDLLRTIEVLGEQCPERVHTRYEELRAIRKVREKNMEKKGWRNERVDE